ncbi:hypothetical protein C8J55DRAFT_524032 [Lentinula edodes]|uniref:Nucleolus and neural progenitor protein-like N-terminal domain-containing protein n=1 Tax=Lentinula lateritia TaxID=40482 RepID=A0A9W9DGD1_9AGAR|nr:hypothetical protein C8J55DRAFT_524032 [Lentinula edodes]
MANGRRLLPTPSPSLSERGSLLKVQHAAVDSVLKDLKLSFRRLSTMTTALADETQVLDRLHYKNKNQHRSSLFSRRINELRRYSHRTEDFQTCSLINDLRQSFFGKVDESQSKQMKGSWSHYPDEKYVQKIKERFSLFLDLLRKMYTISSEAFKFFLLAIQTGAFVQLYLTSIAVTSRLATLVAGMIEILQFVIPVIDRLLPIYKPDTTENPEFTEGKVPEEHTKSPTPPPRPTPTFRKEPLSIILERKVVDKRSKTQKVESTEGRPQRKKAKKKDEIDEIFGL